MDSTQVIQILESIQFIKQFAIAHMIINVIAAGLIMVLIGKSVKYKGGKEIDWFQTYRTGLVKEADALVKLISETRCGISTDCTKLKKAVLDLTRNIFGFKSESLDVPDGYRQMFCSECNMVWVALCFEETTELECPICRQMVKIDMKGTK